MADERLRRIERQAGAGDPEAETALILQRLRQGEVSRDELVLACYLGHTQAARAVPDVASPPVALDDWILGLRAFGKAALVRAAVGLARAVLPGFSAVLPQDERPGVAIAAAEAWLESPPDPAQRVAHRVAARLAGEAADDAARLAAIEPGAGDESAFAAYAARGAAETAAGITVDLAAKALLSAADDAGAILGDAGVRAAIREALLPPALA